MRSPTVWLIRAVFGLIACIASIAPSVAESESSFSQELISLIHGHGPWPSDTTRTDSGNPLSNDPLAQEIGAYLFANPSLSKPRDIACTSCHIPTQGFSDGQPRALGIQAHHRNTQGLLDIAQQRWFGWDGGADSLWSASLRPMLSAIEMGGTITSIANALDSDERFVAARPALEKIAESQTWATNSDEITVVLASKTIGAFLTTLQSPRTQFDELRDALVAADQEQVQKYPIAAANGLKLFFGKAKCHVCHYGPNFSNGEFHDIGRPFIPTAGQIDPGRYRGITRVRNDRYNLAGLFAGKQEQPVAAQRLHQNQTHWGQWRTPTLRNLKLTAPYMHDGSLSTLRDVVDWYADIDVSRLHSNGETILQPLNLSSAERDSLVEFLKTLGPR